MKKVFTCAIFATLAFCGCSKQDPILLDPKLTVEGPGGDYYGDEPVSTPKAVAGLDKKMFISQIDTFYAPTDPVVYQTGALVSEKDSAAVTISVQGEAVYERKYQKIWNQAFQKWAMVNSLVFDYTKPIDCQVISITKILGTGFEKKTTTPVKLNVKAESADVFSVKFGMARADVIANEKARVGSGVIFSEQSPKLVSAGDSFFYEFSDNKLVSISEHDPDEINIRKRVKKLGHPNPASIYFPFSWRYKNLNISFSEKEFTFGTSNKQKYLVITYTPQ